MRMNAGSIGSFEVQNSADDAVRAENDELGRENVVLRAENAELKQVCAELKQTVSEQFGWREVRVYGVGGREYFLQSISGHSCVVEAGSSMSGFYQGRNVG